jgi:hypothetical protein
VTFTEVMEHVAQGFEGLGVLVLAAGTLWSFLLAGLSWRRSGQAGQAYAVMRPGPMRFVRHRQAGRNPNALISRPTMRADRPHG